MGIVEVADELPVWLWPEQDGIRLWTPEETHFFQDVSSAVRSIDMLKGARDGKNEITLTSALKPRELGEKLAEVLGRRDRRPILFLANGGATSTIGVERQDLPLQSTPFEWLSLNGHPVGERVTIARHVPLHIGTVTPAPGRIVHLLDLWPATEPTCPLCGLLEDNPQLASEVKVTLRASSSSYLLRGTDPANYSALIFFGHGTEKAGESFPPLQSDKKGDAWVLPVENGLPPLVVLLACGTDCGNLVAYGRELLQHGAKTVIAPYGRLDAQDSRRFLDSFLPMWLSGERVDIALLEAQRKDPTEWGAKRLTIIGLPGLRRSNSPLLEELDDEHLVEVCEDDLHPGQVEAAAILANRQTLRSFKNGCGLDGAERNLLNILSCREGDERRSRWTYQLYDRVPETYLGRLTRVWLYALQGIGAERYDHARMYHYQMLQEHLPDAAAGLVPAYVHSYWHRIHYRFGHFVAALGELGKSLSQLTKADACTEGVSVVRGVLGLFIEFDMPAAASGVATELMDYLDDRCFENYDVDDRGKQGLVKKERNVLLDYQARAELRSGGNGWKLALSDFRKKRQVSERDLNEDGYRELAWLLYTTAWGNPKSETAQTYAQEVREILELPDGETRLSEVKGNDAWPYLLRSFALWAWRARDAAAASLLSQRYLSLFDDLSTRIDAGPLAFVVGFLQLYAEDTGVLLPNLPDWTQYRQFFINDRYFLETAAFDALMGDAELAREVLERYQRQKDELPKMLSPVAEAMLGFGLFAPHRDLAEAWLSEVDDRSALESSVILSDLPLSAEVLVSSGLLPL